MDLSKRILNIRGEEVPKSFPTKKEIDKLPKINVIEGQPKSGEPDMDQLEKETVGNIILNCLTSYVVRDKKEGFYINDIARVIIAGRDKVQFNKKQLEFLEDVLGECVHRREKQKDDKGIEKEVAVGVYAGWSIAQVSEALGIKNKE